MRLLRAAGCVLLVMAACVGDGADTVPGSGQPVGGNGTGNDASGQPPDTDGGADDAPSDGGAGSRDAGDAGDALPPDFNRPCDPFGTPSGCPSFTKDHHIPLQCFSQHTEAGVAPHDMYGRCIFSCETSGQAGQIDPVREQACASFGATCRPWRSFNAISMCMPLP